MRIDPIVSEVRAIRDALAAQCGHDIKEIFQKLREQQAKSDLQYVRYPARRVARTEGVRGTQPIQKDPMNPSDHAADRCTPAAGQPSTASP